MTTAPHHRGDIDRAIDETARRIGAQTPSPDLRARIMRRLDDEAPTHARHAWRWLTAATLGACAVVAAVVIAPRWHVPAVESRAVVRAPRRDTAAATRASVETARQPIARVAPSGEQAATAPTEDALVPMLPPLEAPAALTLPDISIPALTVDRLTHAPIVIAPIDLDNDQHQ